MNDEEIEDVNQAMLIEQCKATSYWCANVHLCSSVVTTGDSHYQLLEHSGCVVLSV